uniref:Putative secreted protein n=1 Tax=Anopheles darlingi TaxID=43151 RepID=A0A2M4DGV7_ANODA
MLLLALLWFDFLALSILFFFFSVLLMAHRYFRKMQIAIRPALTKMIVTEMMTGSRILIVLASSLAPCAGWARTGP